MALGNTSMSRSLFGLIAFKIFALETCRWVFTSKQDYIQTFIFMVKVKMKCLVHRYQTISEVSIELRLARPSVHIIRYFRYIGSNLVHIVSNNTAP